MKQHLTPQDLDQLTPAGKEKLRAWWKPAEGDFIYTSAWIDDKTKNDLVLCMSSPTGMVWQQMLEGALPLLSIGQMIEFLEDNDFILLIQDPYNEQHSVEEELNWGIYGQLGKQHHSKELCDSLWYACVEILNKERKT